MEKGIKRKYPRIKLSKGILVAWQAGGDRQVSRVTTLALGGVFITTRNPAEVGAMLKLVFHLPGGDVRARAVVRMNETGRGMGIEFISMDPSDRARIQQALKRLLRAGLPPEQPGTAA